MPTIRRRAHNRRQDLMELTVDQRRHLLYGNTWFGAGFVDLDTFRAAWELNQESLFAEFRDDWETTCFPGTWIKPFAWWRCEHKAERPIINPHFTDAEIEAIRAGGGRHATHFGYLHTSVRGGPDMEPLQEQEAAYLARLDLLDDVELDYLDSL